MPTEDSSIRLLKHISDQLHAIAAMLETSVKNDANAVNEPPQGFIEHPLLDIDGQVLDTEWTDPDHVTEQDIRNTPGFKQLAERATKLRLTLELQQEQSVTHPDEDRNGYTIIISGR